MHAIEIAGGLPECRGFPPTSPPPSDDILDRLQTVILALLEEAIEVNTTVTIKHAANALGLSVRTLQRQLTRNNTTFTKVLETLRFDIAKSLLSEATSGITFTAYDLGYRDPSNFSRAFRRWSGKSPREYARVPPRGVISSVDVCY